jgi:hypothetical protein
MAGPPAQLTPGQVKLLDAIPADAITLSNRHLLSRLSGHPASPQPVSLELQEHSNFDITSPDELELSYQYSIATLAYTGKEEWRRGPNENDEKKTKTKISALAARLTPLATSQKADPGSIDVDQIPEGLRAECCLLHVDDITRAVKHVHVL